MRLKDKVAIVTGGGAGIGQAIASRFAAEGARVVIAEVNALCGRAAAEKIVAAGGEAVFIATDVADERQIQSMVAAAVERYGRVDVLCNNAGVLLRGRDARAHELSCETWDLTMAVNLRGYWLAAKYAIPPMLRNGSGSIILLASPTGLFGFQELTAYSASKGGIIGLTRAMAADYARDNIRVNAIVPGTIDTPMNASLFADPSARRQFTEKTLAGRLGVPEDVAGMAVFLASDEAGYCIGGIYTVDGGQTAI